MIAMIAAMKQIQIHVEFPSPMLQWQICEELPLPLVPKNCRTYGGKQCENVVSCIVSYQKQIKTLRAIIVDQ